MPVPGQDAQGAEATRERDVRLGESWKTRLIDEFDKPYMRALKGFLKQEFQGFYHTIEIIPCQEHIFNRQTVSLVFILTAIGGNGQSHGHVRGER